MRRRRLFAVWANFIPTKINLSRRLLDQLDEIADRRDVSRSMVVRELLSAALVFSGAAR